LNETDNLKVLASQISNVFVGGQRKFIDQTTSSGIARFSSSCNYTFSLLYSSPSPSPSMNDIKASRIDLLRGFGFSCIFDVENATA
jgi:transposase-like protein